MWIITKSGFVSLVQHNEKPDLIRARARRRDHLVDTFGLTDDEVIDLGEDAPDYRWHADVSRVDVQEAMVDMIDELDYASHVKEEVAGEDDAFYSVLLRCWSALMTLQRPLPVGASWDNDAWEAWEDLGPITPPPPA